ncbi:glycosyltransferase family 87 protein [Streptomyces sp. NPDC050738]|uniref:glycosyltransferase family 87 protein n=1 Tax=Streptomyces sp. NPDC050738 TaxID=3154744 RepID=UPI00343A7DD4
MSLSADATGLPARRVRDGEVRQARSLWSRHRVPLLATALAVPLYVGWAIWLATGGGDLAAQVSWTDFVARHPGAPYNLSWYGGTYVGNYSLLAPQLMALCGVRTVTVLSGIAASWPAALLFVRSGVRRPLWPALLAVLTLWCNVASGRSTFALGVALALVSCVVLTGGSRRLVTAGVFSALAAMASPVAGLFLLVAGVGRLLDRDARAAVALCAPPVAVVALTTLLFPFSGVMPMATSDVWKPVLFGVLLCALAPGEWRTLRYGAGVYAVGVVLTALIPSPVGSNVVRLAELFGPPALLAALLAHGLQAVRRIAFALALALSVHWVAQHTVHVVEMSTPVPEWAAGTQGVVAALDRLGADRTRVEVVPAVNHRETSTLGRHVDLARGWNRQLDRDRGALFYDGTFSADTYRSWLGHWAVGYVVLPEGTPDWAAQQEAALVRSGPAWLKPVWRDAGWRIYEVEDATPLVTGAGASVLGGDGASLVVRARERGAVSVRIAHSPWLRSSAGCLERAGEWTRLNVPGPGIYRIDSSYRPHWGARC